MFCAYCQGKFTSLGVPLLFFHLMFDAKIWFVQKGGAWNRISTMMLQTGQNSGSLRSSRRETQVCSNSQLHPNSDGLHPSSDGLQHNRHQASVSGMFQLSSSMRVSQKSQHCLSRWKSLLARLKLSKVSNHAWRCRFEEVRKERPHSHSNQTPFFLKTSCFLSVFIVLKPVALHPYLMKQAATYLSKDRTMEGMDF